MEKLETEKDIIKNNLISTIKLIEDNDYYFFYFSPDPDAIGSSMALALYLASINKKCFILLPEQLDKNLNFISDIANYNKIKFISNKEEAEKLLHKSPVIIISDTPTHYLLPFFDVLDKKFHIRDNYPNIIEIDHHFKGDSEQISHNSLTFYINCNSACEIIAEFLAYMSITKTNTMDWDKYFPRNIILCLLVGICFDTQFGKFIHNQEYFDKWFNPLSERLKQQTWNNERYLSSSRHVFEAINRMSDEKNRILNKITSKTFVLANIGLLLMPPVNKYQSLSEKNDSTCVFSKLIQDISNIIPEISGKVGIFCYFDEIASMYYIKMRRSSTYSIYDLRSFESVLSSIFKGDFIGGGGHEGATSFRVSNIERYDFTVKINEFHKKVVKIINQQE